MSAVVIDSGVVVTAGKFLLLTPLNGFTFCLTGKMSLKRSEIEQFITLLGGRTTSAVQSGTDVLIVADEELYSGSAKLQAAKRMGKTIITESQFCEMILPSVDFLRGDADAWTDFGLTT